VLWVTAAAMLFFVGSCSVVGLRLLWLAVRHRGLEELLCGAGFVLVALVGYPLGIASGNGMGTVGQVSLPLFVLGGVFTNGGLGCLYAFTWKAFRPGSRRAAGAALAGTAGLFAGFGWSVGALWAAEPSAPSLQVTHAGSQVLQVFSTVCFAWTAVEGALQTRMARRRVALGLSDPLVAHRFLLWTLYGVSTTLLTLVFAVVQLAGIAPAESVVVHVSTALFGGVSGGAVLLAFVPPARYVAWVERRAAAAAA